MSQARYPNESAAYRAAREKLLQEELALRRQTEKVAAMRRALPEGGAVKEDYVFDDEDGQVRLSELFVTGNSLVAYSYMFGPKMKAPCPMCTSIIDALNGNAVDIQQRVNLVVVAKSPIGRILEFAHQRGWTHLRFLSSEKNTYNRDYHGEAEDGSQMPMLNVFTRKDGVIRHFWGSELRFLPADPGQNERLVDPLWTLWNVLDHTPEGRGDWYPKLSYE